MKRLVLCLLILVTVVAPTRSSASGWPVFDGANLVQSIVRYIVMAKQLAQQVQQYKVIYDQYQDQLENLKNLSPGQLQAMLLGPGAGRDSRLGQSALTLAQYLDPNRAWQPQIEALLRSYYTLPSTSDFQSLLAQAGRTDPAVARWYAAEDLRRRPVHDATHFVAAQEAAASVREDAVERIKRQFRGLGKNSELRQLQAANALAALDIEQQEALIDALHMMVQQQATTTYAQMDAMNRHHVAVLERIAADRADSAVRCAGNCLPAW